MPWRLDDADKWPVTQLKVFPIHHHSYQYLQPKFKSRIFMKLWIKSCQMIYDYYHYWVMSLWTNFICSNLQHMLDYCTGLLTDINQKAWNRLQTMQNQLPDCYQNLENWTHLTPVLMTLHWLCISLGIDFKILLITFKVLHCPASKYTVKLQFFYQPVLSWDPWSETH